MPTKNISFINPIDPVGSQVALQQLQRRQALVDAMREQSLAQIPDNGGRISWSQGAAKLAEAIASRVMQKKLDKQSYNVGIQGANATRGMFGLGPVDGAPPQAGDYTPGKSGIVAGDQPTVREDPGLQTLANMRNGRTQAQLPVDMSGLQPEDGSPAPPPPQAQPQQPLMEQVGGVAPPQAPQPAQRGPWQLSDDPAADYAAYVANPEEYGKALIGARSPVEFAKKLVQSGIPQGSPLFNQLMQSNVAKENYIAPIMGRPGATMRDPINGQIIAQDPQSMQGLNPVIENGQWTGGYSLAPGAAEGEEAMAAARARGEAGSKPVQVFNPQTGQMEYRSAGEVTGGGGAPTRGAGGAGPIDALYGGGGGHFASAPAPGYTQAAGAAGTASGNAFAGIQQSGAGVPGRMQALREMAGALDRGLDTGPAQARFRETAQKLGIPGVISDNAAEFNKWASQYSAQSAQELGLSGSDTRVNLTVHANPNGSMPKGAARQVIGTLYGIEAAKAARANMATAWARTKPQDIGGFETEWRKNYDPKMFEVLQWSPAKRDAWVKALPPARRKDFAQRYDALDKLGAFQ